jgi:hypothetical protein
VVPLTSPPPYTQPASTQAPVQQVIGTPPRPDSHPTGTIPPRPQPPNPPSEQFGTGGGGRWSIQASTPGHQYSGQDQSAVLGEWGRAFISQQGLVSYQADSKLIEASAPGAGDRTSTSTSSFVVGSPGGSGGVVNPGGHALNNNGAVHGNAWWKHPVPGTSEVVTEQIESRSHNEFYDVFKDGQYVGTYQMSADAEHYTQSGYDLWTYTSHGNPHSRGWHPNGGYVSGIDEWNLANVHVAKLPPEPTGLPGDPNALGDPEDTDDSSPDLSVRLDLDDHDFSQAAEQRVGTSSASSDAALSDPQSAQGVDKDLEAISQALNLMVIPDQEVRLDPGKTDSAEAQRQVEAPTPEQIAASMAQFAGKGAEQSGQDAQAAAPSVDPLPSQSQDSLASAPSSSEIAAATEQVIASAPAPTQSPAPNENFLNSEDQDPFRDASPEPSASSDESAAIEEVLAEEPPPSMDQQQDDELPLLG